MGGRLRRGRPGPGLYPLPGLSLADGALPGALSGLAPAHSGGGASSWLQEHILRCFQLFMGTWKSCLPAPLEQPCSLTLQKADCSSSGCAPEGPCVSSSRMRESLGKARPPHTVPDLRSEGLAQHLPLLLRGSTGLGAPSPGRRDHLRARVYQEGYWATVEETGQGLARESGVGFGFQGQDTAQGLGSW